MLGESHGQASDFLSSSLVVLHDPLIQGLLGCPRNIVCSELVPNKLELLVFLVLKHLLKLLLSDSPLLLLLQELIGLRHSHIVLALSLSVDQVLLIGQLFFDLVLQGGLQSLLLCDSSLLCNLFASFGALRGTHLEVFVSLQASTLREIAEELSPADQVISVLIEDSVQQIL